MHRNQRETKNCISPRSLHVQTNMVTIAGEHLNNYIRDISKKVLKTNAIELAGNKSQANVDKFGIEELMQKLMELAKRVARIEQTTNSLKFESDKLVQSIKIMNRKIYSLMDKAVKN